MRQTGHKRIETHMGYMRQAPNDRAHECLSLVRDYRAAADPHETPTAVGGGVIQSQGAKEDRGHPESAYFPTRENKCKSGKGLESLTPTERERLWRIAKRLLGRGEVEAQVLAAVALDAELQRRVLGLSQQ